MSRNLQGKQTLGHQDSSAPKNWCRSVWTFRRQKFLVPNHLMITLNWCRTVLVPKCQFRLQDKTRQ